MSSCSENSGSQKTQKGATKNKSEDKKTERSLIATTPPYGSAPAKVDSPVPNPIPDTPTSLAGRLASTEHRLKKEQERRRQLEFRLNEVETERQEILLENGEAARVAASEKKTLERRCDRYQRQINTANDTIRVLNEEISGFREAQLHDLTVARQLRIQLNDSQMALTAERAAHQVTRDECAALRIQLEPAVDRGGRYHSRESGRYLPNCRSSLAAFLHSFAACFL